MLDQLLGADSGAQLEIPAEAPQLSVKRAYLYLLLLGWLGAHRFYLRRGFSGVIYALTFGFLFIGVLVDLIILPYLVRHANRRLAQEFARPYQSWKKLEHEDPEFADHLQGADPHLSNKKSLLDEFAVHIAQESIW